MGRGSRKAWVTGPLIVLGLFVIIGLSCGRAGASPDPGWNIENVDSEGNVGASSSIALDNNGYPHTSYYDWTNGDLKYARWAGENWSIETVDNVGHVGEYTSIALDSSGNPHISYYDSTNGYLKYARWTGTSWSIQAVDNAETIGGAVSIALDENGYPHISYLDGMYNNLKYARWNGSAWSIETIDNAASEFLPNISMVLDENGYPHISYCDWITHNLKYARWTGSEWNIMTVDSAWDINVSIALDSSGNPHISYYNATDNNLKYTWWTGSEWNIQTVDSAGIGGWTSMALDVNVRPQISYFDWTNNDLKYARWTGSSWKIETVDNLGGIGLYTSIALDDNGYPHISYYDSANGDLKYAYRINATPTLTYNQVIPAVSPAGMTFTYYSIYTDNDEDPPAYIRAYIDNVPHDMVEYDPADDNPTDGKMYKYAWATTTADIGLHGYYFEASDGFDNVREPAEDNYSGPTVEKLMTALTVSPSSFTVKTGSSKSLTTTLTSGGAPLQNKLITWSASEGSVTPSSGYTDSQGKVTVAYTAPDNEATATITASFAEESTYQASSGDVAGTVAQFVAVLTFNRPDGSPFSNYTIYYRFADGETDNYFGATDNQGQIILTDENFAGKQVQFKGEDGKYAGAAYISPAGGEVSVALSPGFEISAGTILSIIVVIAIVALVVMYARGRKWLEKAGKKPPEIPPIK